MNSLPTELNLKVLHHVRDSIPNEAFTSNAEASMTHAEKYNAFLLQMARYHRHWTALAQSELFHHIVLVYKSRTRSLLNLLSKRENDHFRTYAQTASSIRVGYERTGYAQDYDDLKDHLDELAGYCPNIVEISCAGVKAMFSDFEIFKRLDRLNFYGGGHDGSGSFSLSITQLSLQYTRLPTPLNPASFPFLRHLFCACSYDNSVQSILPLLPQITSLHLLVLELTGDADRMLSASTSLASLSISDYNLHRLDDVGYTIIKDRVEVFRFLSGRGMDVTRIVECIAGSKVMRKVILHGIPSTHVSARARIEELKRVVEACEKKNTVELWKENFTVNGKVDLDADVATTFDLA